jgi:hypothetical protein
MSPEIKELRPFTHRVGKLTAYDAGEFPEQAFRDG